MKSEFYKRNADTRDELLASILGAAARIMKSAFNLDEPHVIFVHELLIVMSTMAKFSNIYCKM